MKRYSAEDLQALIEGTTEGDWSEDRIGAVFRSSSHERGARVLMAEVKDPEGKPVSSANRANAVLMTIARNLAVELLDMKTHRYGQEDCDGCAERDAELEKLKCITITDQQITEWATRYDIGRSGTELRAMVEDAATLHLLEVNYEISDGEFTAKRLKRLATVCGLALGNESDEFMLNVAGTVIGSVTRIVEDIFEKHREALEVARLVQQRLTSLGVENRRLKALLTPAQAVEFGMGHPTEDAMREMECRECQQVNFHEDMHGMQEKTAERCAVIASSEPRVLGSGDPSEQIPDPQTRIALKIKQEFGIEDGDPCPKCQSHDTVITRRITGIQGDGQEADATCWRCLQCKEEWSD